MTSFVIADCSIYLATFLPNETFVQQAEYLFTHWRRQTFELAAPILLRYEIASTARKNVFRNRISTQQGHNLIRTVLGRRIRWFSSGMLVRRAYELAGNHNLPTAYDAQYLAVAEYLGCEFWTADEKLVNSVSAQLPWVKWVGGGLPL